MRFFQTVEAYPQCMAWNVQGQCTVCGDRHAQKEFSGVTDKIVKTIGSVTPKQWFTTFKDNDAGAGFVQVVHCFNGLIPGHGRFSLAGTKMKRAGAAGQVASISHFKAGQQGNFTV